MSLRPCRARAGGQERESAGDWGSGWQCCGPCGQHRCVALWPAMGEQFVAGVDRVPESSRSRKIERKGGWVMVVAGAEPRSPIEDVLVERSFAEIWSHACGRGLLVVAVDIPIGLSREAGRPADDQARKKLKSPGPGQPGRASSVFPAPPLCALEASSYEDAQDRAWAESSSGITKQAFALCPKINDVRDSVDAESCAEDARPRLAEVHPEVSFREIAGRPMRFHKKLQAGTAERLAHLAEHFSNIVGSAVLAEIKGPPEPGLDDVLDAVAAAWTARRLAKSIAKPLGGRPTGEEDYPMTIWV